MRRQPDRSCSNPPDRPLVRRLGRLTILAAAVHAWPAAALAQSLWEQAAATLETSCTGLAPVSRQYCRSEEISAVLPTRHFCGVLS